MIKPEIILEQYTGRITSGSYYALTVRYHGQSYLLQLPEAQYSRIGYDSKTDTFDESRIKDFFEAILKGL